MSRSKGAKASSPRMTASTSRWTSSAKRAMSTTPALKRVGNTSPMAASSRTSSVLFKSSTRATVKRPVAAAPAMRRGDERSSTTKKARTIPSRIEWLIASLTSARRRRTRKTPGKAQATATVAAISWISSWAVVIGAPLNVERVDRSFQTAEPLRLRLRCRTEGVRALPAAPPALPARPEVDIASDVSRADLRQACAREPVLGLGETGRRQRPVPVREALHPPPPFELTERPPDLAARGESRQGAFRMSMREPLVLRREGVEIREDRVDLQAAATPHVTDEAPKQSARSHEQRNDDDRGGAEHDGRAGGQPARLAREHGASDPGNRTAQSGEAHDNAEPVRPLPGRDCRRHDDRAHEDDPDRLQPAHDRDHEQRSEQHLDEPHREAQARAERGVEGEEFQLLPEQQEPQERNAAEDRHRREIALEQRGGLAEEEPVQGGLARLPPALDQRQQDEPDAEENGEHDAEGAVFLDAGGADDGHHDQRPHPAGERGPDHERDRSLAAGQ